MVPFTGALHHFIINRQKNCINRSFTVKSGLLYTGLLIVLIVSCTGVVSAAPGDKYLTVDIGQTAVDVSKYVSGDMIGWWPTADTSGPASAYITITDKSAFDIDYGFSPGFWYNINSESGLALDKALNVVDSYLTVDIGQTAVDVSNYVSGDMIAYWITPDAIGPPSRIITIDDKSSFDITHADFGGCPGFWYNINSVAVPLDKALFVVDNYLTVNIGQTAVDVSNYVSGDWVGWWPSGADPYTTAPSKSIPITDTSAFDITSFDFKGCTGFWYNINSESGPAVDIALNVVDSYRTVRIGQKNVDVSEYVSGDVIGYWITADANGAPSQLIQIEDKLAFDITRADFSGRTGFWYNVDSAGLSLDKALNVVGNKNQSN